MKSSTTPYTNVINHLNLSGTAILMSYIPVPQALRFRSYITIHIILRQAAMPWRWCSSSASSQIFSRDLLKSWCYRKKEQTLNSSKRYKTKNTFLTTSKWCIWKIRVLLTNIWYSEFATLSKHYFLEHRQHLNLNKRWMSHLSWFNSSRRDLAI